MRQQQVRDGLEDDVLHAREEERLDRQLDAILDVHAQVELLAAIRLHTQN